MVKRSKQSHPREQQLLHQWVIWRTGRHLLSVMTFLSQPIHRSQSRRMNALSGVLSCLFRSSNQYCESKSVCKNAGSWNISQGLHIIDPSDHTATRPASAISEFFKAKGEFLKRVPFSGFSNKLQSIFCVEPCLIAYQAAEGNPLPTGRLLGLEPR